MSLTYHFAEPPPFEHQVAALRRMIETRGACALLCEPGTGKTRVILDYAAMLAQKQGEARVLVIGPLAALDTWVSQAEEFVPDPLSVWAEVLGGSLVKRSERLTTLGPGEHPRGMGHRRSPTLSVRRGDDRTPSFADGLEGLPQPRIVLAVTNLESFASRRAAPDRSSITVLDLMLRAVAAFQPDLVVVDESHRIKSASSNTSRAMARVRDLTPRRAILTGTPMPHSPLDVYGQWRFLAPEVFSERLADGSVKPWSFSRFRNRYAVMGGYMGREVVGFQRLDELQERILDNAIVVRKEDALDLPKTTDITVPVHLSAKEERAYRQMKDTLATKLESGELLAAPNPLSQMMRLRQITSGHLPNENGDTETIGTTKTDVARGLVEDLMASEDRLVVFAHFVHEVAAIAEAIRRVSGLRVEVVTGGTSTRERQAIRQRFRDTERHPEKTVLVAQKRTMSLAVNELVTASHAIFASLSERRDDLIQARDRLDRMGQTRPVTFWYLMCPGTVDQVMLQAHRDRTSLEEAMLRHVKGNGEAEAVA